MQFAPNFIVVCKTVIYIFLSNFKLFWVSVWGDPENIEVDKFSVLRFFRTLIGGHLVALHHGQPILITNFGKFDHLYLMTN